MDELFGIPMESLAVGIVVALTLVVSAVGALAVRNRIFFKLGIRNVTRRRARTALIVLGLMLGTTIIASALVTGDTMSHTIRTAAITSLGQTDELVSVRGAEVDTEVEVGGTTGIEYFSEEVFPEIEYELLLGHEDLIDGVAPAIVEPLAVQSVTTRQSEPRVTLFASSQAHLGAFGEIRRHSDGEPQYLNDLRRGEVFLNADAAEELQAEPGHELRLYAEGDALPVKVREIVDYEGAGTDGAALLLPLDAAQRLLDRVGEIKHVLISNRGDELAGAELTDEVTAIVNPVVTPRGLEIDPIKRDALEAADAEGNAFMSVFTTFGSFSIFAGGLLIFLIFVMLAAERRGELGIARAVGTRRGHLVQLYLFEGLVYDLFAAVVGVVLGVAVAFGMVFILASALDFSGVEIRHDVQPESLVVAFGVGVLLTFVIVTLSAVRVSRLNIVSAIRNTPEPVARRSRKRRWILGTLAVLVGILLTLSGLSSAGAVPFMLGISLVVVGAVPLARGVGLSERIVFTAAGLLLVDPMAAAVLNGGDPRRQGADVGLRRLDPGRDLRRARLGLDADVQRRPPARRSDRDRRTDPRPHADPEDGDCLSAQEPVPDRGHAGDVHPRRVHDGGGRRDLGLVRPRDEQPGAVRRRVRRPRPGGAHEPDRRDGGRDSPRPGPRPGPFTVVSEQSFLAAEARQIGYDDGFADYGLRGLDEPFLRSTTYGFSAMARGYESADEIWRALADEPGLAVVDAIVAPRRDDWSAGAVLPDFKLQGFVLEDGVFDPLTIATRDPQTGKKLQLTVIGILAETVPFAMQGISTSQETLAGAYGDRVQPTAYYYALAEGADPRAVAPELESAFVANGLEADALEELLEDSIAVQWTFNRLIQGFMGLGLIVGIAALGVISARAVVERRQQIGILRALGFRRRMIQVSFLIESSFIALTAIVVGHAPRAHRRRQRHRRRREPVELERPRGRRALGEPGDHLRRGLRRRAARDARPGGPRVQGLPGRGAPV